MNGKVPPPLPGTPAKKPGPPTWVIVLAVTGAAAFVGIALIGLVAAIAIPNFVRARAAAQKNACINNLRRIDNAKQTWALDKEKQASDVPLASDLSPYLEEGEMPACPAGGIYTIKSVGEAPICSVPGHDLTRP